MKRGDKYVKKQISSKENRLIVRKYASTDWKKKTTVKTYSKSRPCNLKTKGCDTFDDAFGVTSTAGARKKEECLRILDDNTKAYKNYENECGIDDIDYTWGQKIPDPSDDQKELDGTPKNSTCIEGGEGIQRQTTILPSISPIRAFEKTDLDLVSMEMAQSCLSVNSIKQPVDYLSTIGKASPYILAALSGKKKKNHRKFSAMSFIKEKVKESRVTLPKTQSDEDECKEPEQTDSQSKQKEHLEEHSSLPEVDDMCHDQDKTTIEAETDNQDLILSDSDTDSLDVDTELPNYSPPFVQVSSNRNTDHRQTQETNITPEDKDGLFRDAAGTKLRRSLVFQGSPEVPIDLLLLLPPIPPQTNERKRARRRGTYRDRPDRFPIDILLL